VVGDPKVSGCWRPTDGEPAESEVEFAPMKLARLSIKDLQEIHWFLLSLDARRIDVMISSVCAAITDHDWQHPAGAEP
jgi:hypothetical protein